MQIARIVIAAAIALNASLVAAQECTIAVDSTDRMMFDTKEIAISKACKEFTVNLTHSGKLPAAAMGHNWVLSKAADAAAVARAGLGAGLDNQYIEPGDERVIAYTDIIGGGEATSVTFAVSEISANEEYQFFCSFPGHIGLMIGSVTLTD